MEIDKAWIIFRTNALDIDLSKFYEFLCCSLAGHGFILKDRNMYFFGLTSHSAAIELAAEFADVEVID